MSKTKNFKQLLKHGDVDELIVRFKQTLLNSYFDGFWGQFKFSGIDNDQAEHYLQTQLWASGSIWGRADSITGDVVFCKYAGTMFNHYNYPTKVQLVNTHNAPKSMIPSKLQTVGKDGDIIYLRKNQKGLADDVDYFLNKLAEAETCITINLFLQRTPWLFCGGNENIDKIKRLIADLMGNEVAVFTDFEKGDIDALQLNAPYIVDKLTAYEERIENKLKTILGIDNQGGFLNSQQQNLDTTNSNNQEINTHANLYRDEIQKGFDRLNNELGLNLKVELLNEPVVQESTSHGLKDDYGEENNGQND